MTLTEMAKEYFLAFAGKDLGRVGGYLAADVTLRDWDNCAEGKANVLELTEGLFSATGDIHLHIEELYEVDRTVIAELALEVGSSAERLRVVDVLEYDSQNRIHAIRAYKG